ncbi:MAG: response regulator [Burkholderiales bacterium]|nr:response regulator [Burkholderiales bacterium]
MSDSGIGIAPEKLEQIFDPFVQLVTHATTAGTGLGLSLSREYVRLLGGEISVDSTPGKGSAFRFCLNLALAEMPVANQALSTTVTGLPVTQQGKRILIVDDDPHSRLLLCQLLQPLGFIVAQAQDGFAAIEQNTQFAPDLIILDRLLPKLDGMAVIRQVRQHQQANQPQIVVLTGSAMDEQRKEVLEAGANEFLSKPMEESKLFSILERLLHIEFSRSAPIVPALKPAQTELQPADLRILRSELRMALRNGAGEMNQLKLKQDLVLLASEHAALAARILVMVENFRYRELWNLLEESI